MTARIWIAISNSMGAENYIIASTPVESRTRRSLRALLVLLAAVVAVLLSALDPAFAEDHVIGRAILEDKSGELTIDDVARATFEPAGSIIARGYTDSATWVRLLVRPSQADKDIILRIRPAYLDSITLYAPDPERPGFWRQSVTGDRVPFADRPLQAVTLGFPLPPLAADTVFYLRLKSTSSSLMYIEAVDTVDARSIDLLLQMAHAAILGLLVWICCWSLNEYLVRMEGVLAFFALNQFAYFTYGLLLTGYAALLFPNAPPGVIDAVTNVLVCWTPLISFVAVRTLVVPFQPHRFTLIAFDALIFIDVTAMAMLVLGLTRPALQLNGLAVGMAVILIPFAVFTTRREAPPGRRVLRSVFVLQAVSLTLSMAPLLGLIPATAWNLEGMPIHGLISGSLMFFLLSQRSRQLVRAGIDAELDLALTRRQLDLERNQRDLQNRFMAMLTHELKTPLSVVRIAIDTLKPQGPPRRLINSALDNMNAIIDRCNYADQLERHQLQQHNERCELGAVASEVIARSSAPARVVLDVETVPSLVTDRLLLDVLIGNLIDNALKYSPEGSPVIVKIAQREVSGRCGIAVTVENSPGRAGLPDESKLFGKFYRSSGAQSSSGSGLGLYIVRGIAELLGGRIVYRSNEGKAEFSLWLPC